VSWTIERRGRVAVVTMTTNPVNAQNRAFFADLHDVFDRLERDHPDSPVVLTGTGRRFSAGLDLDEHFRLFAGDPAAVGPWFAGYRETNMGLFTYPRPTVAAVNGHAFAGGLITAAVCDHRIAVPDEASFGLNEVPIGIPMPAVYVRMLAYAWGEPVAARTCLLGEIFTPVQAHALGLVRELIPAGTCWTGPWPSPGRRPRTASSSTPLPNEPVRPRPCVTSPASPTLSTPNFPGG
jgi:enoyl-CoA hydratase/carnithine racemase